MDRRTLEIVPPPPGRRNSARRPDRRLPADCTRPLRAQWPRKLPLLDRGGNHVRTLTEAEARELVSCGEVEVLSRPGRVYAVRWRPPIEQDSADVGRGLPSIRGRSLGTPHARETDANPRGVWTIERIPRSLAVEFRRVIEDVAA